MRAGEGLPDHGLILVEGQGSLCHPGSTATLPLLRGSQPTELLRVHRAGQISVDRVDRFPLPPLGEVVMTTDSTQPGWMTGMHRRLLKELSRNSVFRAAILFAGEDKACSVPFWMDEFKRASEGIRTPGWRYHKPLP